MPQCKCCIKSQAKLNNGDLCKYCYKDYKEKEFYTEKGYNNKYKYLTGL